MPHYGRPRIRRSETPVTALDRDERRRTAVFSDWRRERWEADGNRADCNAGRSLAADRTCCAGGDAGQRRERHSQGRQSIQGRSGRNRHRRVPSWKARSPHSRCRCHRQCSRPSSWVAKPRGANRFDLRPIRPRHLTLGDGAIGVEDTDAMPVRAGMPESRPSLAKRPLLPLDWDARSRAGIGAVEPCAPDGVPRLSPGRMTGYRARPPCVSVVAGL